MGWLGGVVTYVVLGFSAVRTSETDVIRGAWLAMEAIGWYGLVPLAIGTVVTGIVLALGTKWGLFRYYWVAISFALTVIAAIVLILHMPEVTAGADVARRGSPAQVKELGGDLLHPLLGLLVLVTVHILNIYKPPGLTPYGWRLESRQSGTQPADGASK